MVSNASRTSSTGSSMTEPTRKLFVLDTNVLMHDPASIFRFHEHDVFIPMVVLEELDRAKKGLSEVARNVRQVSRFLDELIDQLTAEEIGNGIALPTGGETEAAGHLFLQTSLLPASLPESLPGDMPDNTILGMALALKERPAKQEVAVVSKDINLRIKARLVGLHAEDYANDKVLDDVDLLYRGINALADDFWEQNADSLESWQAGGRSFYRVKLPADQRWHLNQCVHTRGDNAMESVVRELDGDTAKLEVLTDFRSKRHAVWGINARNREQNFALNLLLDPDIDFVTLLGIAGTGKTLLALAAGLAQTIDDKRFREIIVTRVTVPVGEDIGFLPGTEEEKMTPWMGALMDNLEVLTDSESNAHGEWGRLAAQDLLNSRIKIRSLNFMRGRTFLNRYVIIDEAQNLTPKQMKTLITRAGPGTKVVCLGNIGQIDTPYLSETTSGLTYLVDRFKGWRHGGHATLIRGERSRLADFAAKVL